MPSVKHTKIGESHAFPDSLGKYLQFNKGKERIEIKSLIIYAIF